MTFPNGKIFFVVTCLSLEKPYQVHYSDALPLPNFLRTLSKTGLNNTANLDST